MPDAIKPERVTMAVACAITGKKPRSLRGMCLAGQVPGAAKLGGEWTFNEAQLRAWIDDLEQQPASTRVRKRRPTPPPWKSPIRTSDSEVARETLRLSALLSLQS
jgi:hypothetical protein